MLELESEPVITLGRNRKPRLSDYVKVGVAGCANGARLSFHEHSRQLESSGTRPVTRADAEKWL
jgi:hypothetical protein